MVVLTLFYIVVIDDDGLYILGYIDVDDLSILDYILSCTLFDGIDYYYAIDTAGGLSGISFT